MSALLAKARKQFHNELCGSLLSVGTTGVASNADKDSKTSVAVALKVATVLGAKASEKKLAGQTAGEVFETICAHYIERTFGLLRHLRPGDFGVEKGGHISRFQQYEHLEALAAIAKANKELATAIGSDYLIKPDVVVYRSTVTDEFINSSAKLVDGSVAQLTSVRAANQILPILHASISCKWTLRSDRAQNARSEGLNLVRNRKGRLPHIAVITGEPLPSRIASLALGTGDIDCVYHVALPETVSAFKELDRDTDVELLNTMIEGRRLRDIADLPLDLTV